MGEEVESAGCLRDPSGDRSLANKENREVVLPIVPANDAHHVRDDGRGLVECPGHRYSQDGRVTAIRNLPVRAGVVILADAGNDIRAERGDVEEQVLDQRFVLWIDDGVGVRVDNHYFRGQAGASETLFEKPVASVGLRFPHQDALGSEPTFPQPAGHSNGGAECHNPDRNDDPRATGG